MQHYIPSETVSHIRSLGYRVFVPVSGLKTYLFYELKGQIAYMQNDQRGLVISTVHKPSRGNGSGYHIAEGLPDKPSASELNRAFVFRPNWASGDAMPTKYKSVSEFLDSRAVVPLKELTN